ncbi:transporter [Calycomorphotria hydatis]|uniref:Transporter n=1 Tax=Calycomorphotria hydatis TaxID=2528027 RepID=A0A517T934_9PLAN|nr:transporter [Calycomorphotria hydatis]QDT64873.1 hypothetical protein V22_21160 [Calycomorphotria hydatis]
MFKAGKLPLLVLIAATITSRADGGELFPFLDDFSKPQSEQRDPYEERIETERHDFTQSAVTVGNKVFQIEAGHSYFYKDNEEEIESAHTLPEMLLRYGISEDIEVRLRWNYAWVFIDEAEDEIGSEDLRYGIKLQISRFEESCLLPTSAVEIRGSAPTGGESFTTDRAEFSLDYIYQWELAEGVTLAGSTGYGTNGFGDFGLIPEEPSEDAFNVLSQSAVLGLELSEANTLYIEWYGIYSQGLEDDFVVSVINAGVDHYITDNFVVDFRIGAGLTNDSDDFFTGWGGGWRF